VSDFAFLHPGSAWVGLSAAAALAVWAAARRPRFYAATTLAHLEPARYRASIVRRLPVFLLLGALGLLTVAAMDPVVPYAEGQVVSRGLDIVLLLELSSSMQELMALGPATRGPGRFGFAPVPGAPGPKVPGKTRLVVTKDALRDFIAHRRDDRIALVVFSDNAYVVSPLTFDHEYLLRYIDMVDEKILAGEGMTAIGEGVALARTLLARQARSGASGEKVIVVFTDGENNHGRDPVEAIQDVAAAGARVHVVGVDLEDEIKKKPEVLRLIAQVRRLGGKYYSADTARELEAAYLDINALEKGFLTSKVYRRNVPVFGWFAVPALVLLAAAFVLRSLPYFARLA
jgi:Ca-activated chloride channel family protein